MITTDRLEGWPPQGRAVLKANFKYNNVDVENASLQDAGVPNSVARADEIDKTTPSDLRHEPFLIGRHPAVQHRAGELLHGP